MKRIGARAVDLAHMAWISDCDHMLALPPRPLGLAVVLTCALTGLAHAEPPPADALAKWPLAKVEAAMKALPSVDQPYADGTFTALMQAAQLGRTQVVTLLLRLGADPDRIDESNPLGDACTSLYFAVHAPADSAAVLEALFKGGARLDANRNCPHPPLIAAAEAGNLAAVRVFLAKGADPNVLSMSGRTPLTAVASVSSSPPPQLGAIAEELLRAGVDVNRRDALGQTPLLAAINGPTDLWRTFLDRGGDPRITDNKGDTALGVAWPDRKQRVADAAARMKAPVPPPVLSKWRFGGNPMSIGSAARVAATDDGMHVLDPAGNELGSAPAAPNYSNGYGSRDELLDLDGDGVRDYSMVLDFSSNAHPYKASLYLSLRGGRTNLLVTYYEGKRVLTGNTTVPSALRDVVTRELARRGYGDVSALWSSYQPMANVALVRQLERAHVEARTAHEMHQPAEAVETFGDPLANLSVVDPSGHDDQVTAILNDYGFFLDQAGKHEKAVTVLRMVIARDPNRTVAYLNLADAEYARHDKRGAAVHYAHYAALMKDAGKADKLPARVGQRSRP
jgi:hypothetical protein